MEFNKGPGERFLASDQAAAGARGPASPGFPARQTRFRKRAPVWHSFGCWSAWIVFLWITAPVDALAQSLDWGGSLRGYQFLRLEDVPEVLGITRRDSEFFSGRWTLETEFRSEVKLEAHLVLDILSPPDSVAAVVAAGRKSTYLPLEHRLTDDPDVSLTGSFDRLNLQLDFKSFRVTFGRQAIGWGVTYFWPSFDFFSSFAPQRIDRDYKEGVDAVRVTVPLGSFSEVQVVGGALGPSLEDDGAVASQVRLHLGRLDLGFMAGKVHRDTVAGLFLTTQALGTAYRGEVTCTDSGDPFDHEIDRDRFWRASVGLDRQLSPKVGVTAEFSYNGYGADNSTEYARWLESDRTQRGEISALGRFYAGSGVVWQVHPLWTLTQTLLVNWQDPSAFWIPAVEWSTSNNSTLLFAAQAGFGGGLNPDLSLESEYGAVPATLFAAFKWYF